MGPEVAVVTHVITAVKLYQYNVREARYLAIQWPMGQRHRVRGEQTDAFTWFKAEAILMAPSQLDGN